jgi:hypothetical protein
MEGVIVCPVANNKLSPAPIYLFICGCTSLVDLGRFFSFLILYKVDRTP